MERYPISRVSKLFGITPRTLRYYEEIGLIQSIKLDNYAYRTYSEDTILRIRQILLLRKLRIPLKKIGEILQTKDAVYAVEVFSHSIAELSDEIMALEAIRGILEDLSAKLKESTGTGLEESLLSDNKLLAVIDSLTTSKINFKEERTMSDLNNAVAKLSKIEDVRIIYLPPSAVASIACVGDNPEERSAAILSDFVLKNDLKSKKPDIRQFGFNNPIQEVEHFDPALHGYERLVTIPDDLEVPAPLTKKRLLGGLYAAHGIKFGEFDHWAMLYQWVEHSRDYEADWGSVRLTPHKEEMDWAFEEHLNYLTSIGNENFNPFTIQLDLLYPVKEKAK